MAATPHWKIYSPTGEYVAACHYGEDAACLAGMYGDGATIRDGHAKRDIMWSEGAEEFPASESYDRCAAVLRERLDARWQASKLGRLSQSLA